MTIVLDLIADLQGRWHTIITDNFFTSVRLQHELLCRGFWATGTVRCGRFGLPKEIKRSRSKIHRGSILIKMHCHRPMVAISWQDKKVVIFLSTAAVGWKPDVKVS
jgi:hypothetical protein